jgi:RNA polymerase sigma-70 factor (ECF subfamily)
VRLARTSAGRWDMRPVDVNGMPGLLILDREDRQVSVVAFTVDDGRITTIHIQRNPDKLRHVTPPQRHR